MANLSTRIDGADAVGWEEMKPDRGYGTALWSSAPWRDLALSWLDDRLEDSYLGGA